MFLGCTRPLCCPSKASAVCVGERQWEQLGLEEVAPCGPIWWCGQAETFPVWNRDEKEGAVHCEYHRCVDSNWALKNGVHFLLNYFQIPPPASQQAWISAQEIQCSVSNCLLLQFWRSPHRHVTLSTQIQCMLVFRRKSVFIERERSPIISDVATWALSYLTGENPVSWAFVRGCTSSRTFFLWI